VTKPGGGTPTGTVQFGIDGSPFEAAQSVNGSGVATISTAALSVGAHGVTASFASDSPATLNSNASLTGGQQVNAAATTTGIASSRNPAEFGVAVTFTANVNVNAPGAGTPTGAVRFRDNGADLGAPLLDGTGQATRTGAPPESRSPSEGIVMGRRSRFDEGFRVQAVELARGSRRPRYEIAADLGVSDTTLANWMTASSNDKFPEALTIPERVELEQLRGEKREWVLEREILKKATAFWVKESRV
jgi:transposase-like protein